MLSPKTLLMKDSQVTFMICKVINFHLLKVETISYTGDRNRVSSLGKKN